MKTKIIFAVSVIVDILNEIDIWSDKGCIASCPLARHALVLKGER